MSQWADDSMTPSPISVKRDKQGNEIPENGRYTHDCATPEEGNFHWEGNQYDDSPGKSGYGSYGKSVEDLGKSPKVERTIVNAGKADRGSDS